jgi:hypothetical protein
MDMIYERASVTACCKNKDNLSALPLRLIPLLFVSFALACYVTMAADAGDDIDESA